MGSFNGKAEIIGCFACCAIVQFSSENVAGWESATRLPPPFGYGDNPPLFGSTGTYAYYTTYWNEYVFTHVFDPKGSSAHPFNPRYGPRSILPNNFFGEYGRNVLVKVSWVELICPPNSIIKQ